jgi:predicted metalloprotease with PDZ domain
LLATLFIAGSFSLQAQDKYQYTVDLTKTANDELTVTLLTPKVNTASIIFYMPKIVPGTYTNSDFGKFVKNVKALIMRPEKNSLVVKQTPDSNGWQDR